MAVSTQRTIPLLVTALVALVAIAAAAWLVFFAPDPKTLTDEPTLPAPVNPEPAPMPAPATAP